MILMVYNCAQTCILPVARSLYRYIENFRTVNASSMLITVFRSLRVVDNYAEKLTISTRQPGNDVCNYG